MIQAFQRYFPNLTLTDTGRRSLIPSARLLKINYAFAAASYSALAELADSRAMRAFALA